MAEKLGGEKPNGRTLVRLSRRRGEKARSKRRIREKVTIRK